MAARSPNGEHIYAAHSSLSIVMDLDLLTNKISDIPIPVDGEFGSVTGVAVAPNGQYIYASQIDGDHWRFGSPSASKTITDLKFATNVVKINAATGKIVKKLTIPASTAAVEGLPGNPVNTSTSGDRLGSLWPVSVSADGTLGAVSFRRIGESRVLLIDLNTMTIQKDFDVTADITDIRDVAISPDGKFIYLATHRDGDGDLHVLDVATGKVATAFTTGSNVRSQGLKFDYDSVTKTYSLYWAKRNGGNDMDIFTFTGGDYSMPTGNAGFNFSGTPDGFDFGPYGDFYYICTTNDTVEKIKKSDNSLIYESNASSTDDLRHGCAVSAY